MKIYLHRCFSVLSAFLVCFQVASAQDRGYGDPDPLWPEFPNWHESAILELTNACRMDPEGYRDKYVGNYSILLPPSYPVAGPVYWQVDLNRSARAQAADMAQNCGLQHESCNGDKWTVRIASYYKKSAPSIAENIATGGTQPQETMRQWIMDGNPPASDKSAWAGHRTNIMSLSNREMGAGYAYGPVEHNHFWVQDFSGGKPSVCYRIPSASHIFTSKDSIRFMASYYDSLDRAPRDARVTIDGQSFGLTPHLGTSSRGTWAFDAASRAFCRNYYFTFTDSDGREWRYPEYGALVTYGEGDCEVSYLSPEDMIVKSGGIPYRLEVQKDGPGVRKTDLAGRIIRSGVKNNAATQGVNILTVQQNLEGTKKLEIR